MSYEKAIAGVEELVAEAGVPGVTLVARAAPRVGYYERPDEPSVASLARAVEVVTGEKPRLTLMPWGTDATSIKRNIRTEMHPEKKADGYHIYTVSWSSLRSGQQGYTARVLPNHPGLTNISLPGLTKWAEIV